jgi:hypothetical protein
MQGKIARGTFMRGSTIAQGSSGRAVVEHLPHNPKVEGLSPTAGTGT